MDNKKDIDFSKMSETDFLNFLYSERGREESLNSYQGWNLWAAFGAMITVACTANNIICWKKLYPICLLPDVEPAHS